MKWLRSFWNTDKWYVRWADNLAVGLGLLLVALLGLMIAYSLIWGWPLSLEAHNRLPNPEIMLRVVRLHASAGHVAGC
jgi:hypothetical protein